jgi:hypothetical protein
MVFPSRGRGRFRQSFIMDQFDPSDADLGPSGRAWTLREKFDGFIANTQYENTTHWTTIKNLVGLGKLFWRYENAFNYPYSLSEFGADRLSDYVRGTWQFVSNAAGAATKYRFLLTARTPDVVACHWYYISNGAKAERYELTPFKSFAYSDLDAWATSEVQLARDPFGDGVSYYNPNAGVFMDNCYHDVRAWMIPNDQVNNSGHGNAADTAPYLKTCYETPGYQTDWIDLCNAHGDAGQWTGYVDKYTYLSSKVGDACALTGSMWGATPYRIINCPETGPNHGFQHQMPWMFENVYSNNLRTAVSSLDLFTQDQRNVIHHNCDGTSISWDRVVEMVSVWLAAGGWIQFGWTSDSGAYQQYLDALDYAIAQRN